MRRAMPVAVARPVIGGRTKITSLPWVIEETSPAQEMNPNPESVHLIFDLEAIARAVPILWPSDVETISAGKPHPRSRPRYGVFDEKVGSPTLMARIPIHVVVSRPGLAGAAACGLEIRNLKTP
jgi:glucokinase